MIAAATARGINDFGFFFFVSGFEVSLLSVSAFTSASTVFLRFASFFASFSALALASTPVSFFVVGSLLFFFLLPASSSFISCATDLVRFSGSTAIPAISASSCPDAIFAPSADGGLSVSSIILSTELSGVTPVRSLYIVAQRA